MNNRLCTTRKPMHYWVIGANSGICVHCDSRLHLPGLDNGFIYTEFILVKSVPLALIISFYKIVRLFRDSSGHSCFLWVRRACSDLFPLVLKHSFLTVLKVRHFLCLHTDWNHRVRWVYTANPDVILDLKSYVNDLFYCKLLNNYFFHVKYS